MLAQRILSCALIAAFVCLPAATKTRKKVERAPNVLSPTGAKSAPDAKLDASYGGAEIIKEYTNELGQKVHWIGASHFDVSPPLREMAAAAVIERKEMGSEPPEESEE